jgi:hypothetical protein
MRSLIYGTLGFGAFAAAALAVTGVLLSRPLNIAAIPPEPKLIAFAARQPLAESFGRPSPEHVKIIAARPLFSKTRRAFVPPPAAPTPPPAAKTPTAPQPAPVAANTLILRGVLLSGATARALVASPISPEGTWLKDGEQIEGWVIQDIQPGSVRLAQDGQIAELALYPPSQNLALPVREQPFMDAQDLINRK